jgi:hypothetical protein
MEPEKKEVLPLTSEDKEKAKKKGTMQGDPVFSVDE